MAEINESTTYYSKSLNQIKTVLEDVIKRIDEHKLKNLVLVYELNDNQMLSIVTGNLYMAGMMSLTMTMKIKDLIDSEKKND